MFFVLCGQTRTIALSRDAAKTVISHLHSPFLTLWSAGPQVPLGGVGGVDGGSSMLCSFHLEVRVQTWSFQQWLDSALLTSACRRPVCCLEQGRGAPPLLCFAVWELVVPTGFTSFPWTGKGFWPSQSTLSPKASAPQQSDCVPSDVKGLKLRSPPSPTLSSTIPSPFF